MFKLQYPDGQFSAGGSPSTIGSAHLYGTYYIKDNICFPANKVGKLWNKAAHLKNHLRILEHYDYDQMKLIEDADKIQDAVVIEYELVEKRRLTVKEFVEEGNAR